MQWKRSVRFLSVLSSALSTGVLFGTRVALGPSSASFASRTYVEVQQATVRNLRPVMGPLLPAAVLTNVAVLLLERDDRVGFGLQALGLTGQVGALVLTAAVELPINAKVMAWSKDAPPPGWEALRDRWNAVHTARTAAAVLGLGGLLAASVLPRR